MVTLSGKHSPHHRKHGNTHDQLSYQPPFAAIRGTLKQSKPSPTPFRALWSNIIVQS